MRSYRAYSRTQRARERNESKEESRIKFKKNDRRIEEEKESQFVYKQMIRRRNNRPTDTAPGTSPLTVRRGLACSLFLGASNEEQARDRASSRAQGRARTVSNYFGFCLLRLRLGRYTPLVISYTSLVPPPASALSSYT